MRMHEALSRCLSCDPVGEWTTIGWRWDSLARNAQLSVAELAPATTAQPTATAGL